MLKLHTLTCRYCGAEFVSNSARLYCSTACRRHYQDARRKAERDELKALRHEDKAGAAWLDPWSRCDVDDWTAEEILANALLDPLPAGLGWDDSGKVRVTSRAVRTKGEARGNHEETMRSDKGGEITTRLAKRKARRESRRERRRRLRGSVRKV